MVHQLLYLYISAAAQHFNKHPRSIENWIGLGFITGYDDGSGKIKVNVAEVEHALANNSRMRDGRKKYGPKSTIKPLPITAVGVER